MKGVERDIIYWGKRLFERKLITGWGGNISCRIGKGRFLITGQHAPLGFLCPGDLVEIGRKGQPIKKRQQPSSETPLHLAVYEGTQAKTVIHAHPPRILTFSLGHQSFVPLSFEEKYTIGEVPILPQDTPTVTHTDRVVEELRLHPIIILQGHGTVAVGNDLREAFLVTDLLEEAVYCQFLKNERSLPVANSLPIPFEAGGEGGHVLFSREHMAALAEGANSDPEFQKLGNATGLTTSLTLHSEDSDTCWTFHFVAGKITGLNAGGEGEFVISGKKEWWEAVFRRRMDPFLATQQGKLKLTRGELWRLSRWFKPFQRGFTLWQGIPIR
ncbi:MAG: class II aldolase/adducin family protein [Candidatus Binatia bacterium]